MDQQSKTFLFIGGIFIIVMLQATFLIAIGKVDPSAFLQFGGMVIAAVAGLLAPSPISVGKPVPPAIEPPKLA